MKKILLFIIAAISAIFLTGCINKNDYAYNEYVAHTYIYISQESEKMYSDLKKDHYETNSQFKAHSYKFGSNELDKQVNSYKENIQKEKDHIMTLKHSKDAQAFHEAMISYFDFLMNDYAGAFQTFLDADHTSADSVNNARSLIDTKYKELCEKDDQLLAIQLEFLKKAKLIKVTK